MSQKIHATSVKRHLFSSWRRILLPALAEKHNFRWWHIRPKTRKGFWVWRIVPLFPLLHLLIVEKVIDGKLIVWLVFVEPVIHCSSLKSALPLKDPRRSYYTKYLLYSLWITEVSQCSPHNLCLLHFGMLGLAVEDGVKRRVHVGNEGASTLPTVLEDLIFSLSSASFPLHHYGSQNFKKKSQL